MTDMARDLAFESKWFDIAGSESGVDAAAFTNFAWSRAPLDPVRDVGDRSLLFEGLEELGDCGMYLVWFAGFEASGRHPAAVGLSFGALKHVVQAFELLREANDLETGARAAPFDACVTPVETGAVPAIRSTNQPKGKSDDR